MLPSASPRGGFHERAADRLQRRSPGHERDARGRLRGEGQDVSLAFGRHRGRSIEAVHKHDKSYFEWLVSPAGGLEDEVIANLRERFN